MQPIFSKILITFQFWRMKTGKYQEKNSTINKNRTIIEPYGGELVNLLVSEGSQGIM
jgi:hypothetical protein